MLYCPELKCCTVHLALHLLSHLETVKINVQITYLKPGWYQILKLFIYLFSTEVRNVKLIPPERVRSMAYKYASN